jgi:hypothetical protein
MPAVHFASVQSSPQKQRLQTRSAVEQKAITFFYVLIATRKFDFESQLKKP